MLRTILAAVCIAAALCAGMSSADARRHSHHHHVRHATVNSHGSGIVRSKKTGATALVAVRHRGVFQSYIDAVEAAGASIKFMGGFRAGECSLPRHKHPCGMALDVCQLFRGVVDESCNLPSPARLASIAANVGLFEGGLWCDNDYGHAEVRGGAPSCRHRHYAMGRAIHVGHTQIASRSRHARHYVIRRYRHHGYHAYAMARPSYGFPF